MMRVVIVGNGQRIEFDAESMKAISQAAAAFGLSVETLKEEIQKLLQNQRVSEELERLGELAEVAAMRIKELDYTFVSLHKERVYCVYKPKLHALDKRRCFKPKIHWKRTRSNPR